MFLYKFVIVSTRNERRPEIIFNGRRLLSPLPFCDSPHYMAVIIYFHVGSEEVLLNFWELLIHINALSRIEINS